MTNLLNLVAFPTRKSSFGLPSYIGPELYISRGEALLRQVSKRRYSGEISANLTCLRAPNPGI
jgi:hypothetical protein